MRAAVEQGRDTARIDSGPRNKLQREDETPQNRQDLGSPYRTQEEKQALLVTCKNMRRSTVLGLLGVALYCNTLWAEFTYDDLVAVVCTGFPGGQGELPIITTPVAPTDRQPGCCRPQPFDLVCLPTRFLVT